MLTAGAEQLAAEPPSLPPMHWADASRGRPFAKDPSVVRFRNRTLLYYSIPPAWEKSPASAKSAAKPWTAGWCIGVAESRGDLDH